MVIADGEQIRRVIHNIISNAIKYMDKPKGIIQIRIKDVGDFIQIEIEGRFVTQQRVIVPNG